MPTYTNLGIKKITTGDEANTWGDSTNTNFDYFDTAIVGYVSIAMTADYISGAPYLLNVADFAASNGRNRVIEFTGTPGQASYVRITPNDFEGYYFIRNSVSGGYSVYVFQTDAYDSAKDIEIPNGKDFIIRCDGGGSTLAVVSSVLDNPKFTSIDVGTVNATTLDLTNLEVTNIKAKDGTASMTIADSTGEVTVAGTINAGRLFYANGTTDSGSIGGFRDNRSFNGSASVSLSSFSTAGIANTGVGFITNLYGFSATGITQGTNNYGFHANIDASGTSRYAFYSAGTAPNYFNGETTFGGTVNAATVNVTTLDTTNIEVTNLKAKDGTSAGSIANSTGVVTLASSVLTTTDINGGTIDGTVIGTASPKQATFSGTSGTGTVVRVGGTDTSSLSTTIAYDDVMVMSSSSLSHVSFYSAPSASSASVSALHGFYANGCELNSGSTAVTDQYGFYASNAVSNATNNYGFYSNLNTVGNNYNFYAASAAPNYFLGTTTFGGTVNATTLDTTNIEVTNLKAKDGTSAGSIANSTGVVTLASSVLTTTDINGGTIDGATIGTASARRAVFNRATANTTAVVSLTGTDASTIISSSRGYEDIMTLSSTVTSDHSSFFAAPSVSAAPMGSLYCYFANGCGLGSGASVTDQYGFFASQYLFNGTNNYGFYAEVGNIGTNYNFYAASAAPNYFSGNVGIGKTPSTKLEVAASNNALTSDTANNTLRFTDTDTTTVANQPIGKIEFYTSDANNAAVGAYILSSAVGVSGGGTLRFGAAANAGAVAEIARVASTGLTVTAATAGLGYGTGSGGAVTQATGRTTGVTLDKTNGAITLVSAAGSTSWQSFTVTNSTVAATDTVIVNQKSGTDLYMIHVTAVAAGSFRITFATTGGTTTEQPVFNFAVIKAVAA